MDCYQQAVTPWRSTTFTGRAVPHGNRRLATGNNVFLVGTTNHPENIDPRVLRGGRFSEKIQIPLPDTDQRTQLLKRHLQGTRLVPGLATIDIAERLSGMSPADLLAISVTAKRMAFNRLHAGDQLPPLKLERF